MKTLAVIHARGGSVRIPLKNIRLLGGKPLINWVIDAALKSRCDRVIVSTDHEEIARISREAGAEVPFYRPSHLAEDVASELVTLHAVEFHEKEVGEKLEIVVTIQPTTPFIQGKDIDGCLDLLEQNLQLGSVFTAKQVVEHPEWMFVMQEGGKAIKYLPGQIQGDIGICQLLQKLWIPNGGAYATRRSVLFEKNLLICEDTGILPMDQDHSVDIDEEVDFIVAAETLIKFAGKEFS